jgi:transcriptional regulator with XRE-family HTH domain
MAINYRDPNWLTDLMDARSVTIAELSARSGVSRDQIERLRKDGTATRLKTAHTLADALAA